MDDFLKNCSAAILAGGENRRMPVLKAFIKVYPVRKKATSQFSNGVNGEGIIERNLRILKQFFKEIFVVTNQPENYLRLGTPLLGDIYNLRCPMTGIFTSLLNSSNNWVFISACDMPFINKDLIKYMASKRDNYNAVVPKSLRPPFTKGGARGDYMEPLFAFYSKQLMPSMEKTILSDKTGIKDFLGDKKVKYIHTEEIKKLDVKAISFINLNTLKDLENYLHTRIKG